MGPYDVQVGGDHYKRFKIQPGVFAEENCLSFWESCVVKRICRYRHPGGKGIQDLEKIKHEVDMLIAQHYPGTRFCECGAAMQECQSVTYMPVYVCQKCGRHEPKE